MDSLTPIYSAANDTDPRKSDQNIPKRPQGQRTDPPPAANNPFGGMNFSFGFMGFPGFGFGWVLNNFTIE